MSEQQQQQQQKPTVGRIVHYKAFGTPGGEYAPKCRAAVVTEVGSWMHVETLEQLGDEQVVRERFDPTACSVSVLNPTGLFFNTVPQDEENKAGGTWHWPERDE